MDTGPYSLRPEGIYLARMSKNVRVVLTAIVIAAVCGFVDGGMQQVFPAYERFMHDHVYVRGMMRGVIIGVIVAVTLPKLLRSRRSQDDAE